MLNPKYPSRPQDDPKINHEESNTESERTTIVQSPACAVKGKSLGVDSLRCDFKLDDRRRNFITVGTRKLLDAVDRTYCTTQHMYLTIHLWNTKANTGLYCSKPEAWVHFILLRICNFKVNINIVSAKHNGWSKTQSLYLSYHMLCDNKKFKDNGLFIFVCENVSENECLLKHLGKYIKKASQILEMAE